MNAMAVTGNQHQFSLGLAMASFALVSESIAASVRRGQVTSTEAAAMVKRAHNALAKAAAAFPGDPAAQKIAEGLLTLAGQIISAAAAEMPPSGAH
jgi:hypothetical protein